MRDVLDTGYMDHHVAYALGAAEAQLGHPDEAVKWLRTAAETGFPCYQWAERDTLLNPIRSDGRFSILSRGASNGLRSHAGAIHYRIENARLAPRHATPATPSA
jgi:hypothetical protein